MKRILIIVALILSLCSPANAFQDGGGKPTKTPPAKTTTPSTPKPKVEPHKRSSTPAPAVEVTTPSGLKYLDKVVGTGESPRPGQNVTVHYAGTLANGAKVDSSVDRGQPYTFQIGVGRVIKGWDEGVMTMKVGGKRRLIIPSNLGYGAAGRPPKVPPDATLIFELELLSVSADNNTPTSPAAAPATHEEEEWRAQPKVPTNAANTKANPAVGLGALPLRSFEFEVVTVNSTGAITNRRKGQSRYCSEQVNGVDLELVELSGGTFLMGNTDSEAEKVKKEYERNGMKAEDAATYSQWEVPRHSVSVPTFFMGKYEVTQGQWRAVSRLPKINRDLVSDPSRFKGDSLPVEQVSWEDAIEFCARLSRETGRTYRLPTEAEWEYACRGGMTTTFYLGDTITPELVNYNGNYPYGSAAKGTYRETTTAVGSVGYPNAFGLYDMLGNVWEWCMDCWHESYDGTPTDGSSWESGGNASRRVLRGGSWRYPAASCRSAYRNWSSPEHRFILVGFRVVAGVRTP